MKSRVLGYAVFAGSVDDCVRDVIASVAEGRRSRWLACINPHSYVVARGRGEFRMALEAADWLVPDGIGFVFGARFLGERMTERVTGFDIFEGVNASLNSRGGGSVFLLGSSDETLEKMRLGIERDWPSLRVCGVYSPPFRVKFTEADSLAMREAVNAAKPDVLWVGMTAPKQEEWLHSNLHRLNFGFAAAVGAVFDFYAGNIRRSPALFRRAGLEWLPRLLQEPRRLWRRTLVSGPMFVWSVVKARFTAGR